MHLAICLISGRDNLFRFDSVKRSLSIFLGTIKGGSDGALDDAIFVALISRSVSGPSPNGHMWMVGKKEKGESGYKPGQEKASNRREEVRHKRTHPPASKSRFTCSKRRTDSLC